MYAKPPSADRERVAPLRAPLWHRLVAGMLKTVVPLVLLAAGAWLARDIYLAAPEARRASPERQARLVEVALARSAVSGPVLQGYGTVEAARRLVLDAEVGGRVVELGPGLVVGGRVKAGDLLLRLDDRDIALEVAEAEAEVERLRAQLRMEAGQRSRAERDLARSPLRNLTDEQRALILREPQRAELEATRDAAAARLESARRRMAKTEIRAPFDALVESETVSIGTVLSSGEEAARLVATDRFRVRLSLPPEGLRWLDVERDQTVILTQPGLWASGAVREGRIERLNPALTSEGRMAELIARVEAPLDGGPDQPALLLGAYVEARIEAPPLPGAVAIERAWLRNGDRVWVMSADDRLEVRRVAVLWAGRDIALVTEGLVPGERIVTTRLAMYSEGMALRVPQPVETSAQ